ncbi:MAG TPA: hypothetical protein VE377_04700 [Candidatus Dormibacteraeota bacterium]|nr:hypothetical protein [Candidatus Dormibacteraeota bacterium]
MKSRLLFALLAVSLFAFTLSAGARDVVVPAGTLLQCTLNEPNFSSATADVGDPVLCHLRGITVFGQQAFPRGSYLVGHLEAAKDPGHFWGKGYLKLQFDRIGVPSGDLPLEAKVIATRGYKVDKEGKIDGRGHATRDIVEWMLPPLWPWKVIMLPARGPRPKLKGETVLSMRLMDDVQIPQMAQTYGPGWRFFGQMQRNSFDNAQLNTIRPQPTVRSASDPAVPQVSFATYVTRPAAAPSGLANVVTLPGMPVFVLTTGALLSVSGYGYSDSRITYTLIGGGSGVIGTDDVDWSATTQLNNQRGVRLALHAGHAVAGTPGL